jgi:hypothetical protein
MIPEADEVLKEIIRDIVAQANDHTRPTATPGDAQAPAVATPKPLITETLAAFVLRALVINPKEGFDMSKELSQNEVKKLIQVRSSIAKPLLTPRRNAWRNCRKTRISPLRQSRCKCISMRISQRSKIT